MPSCFQSILAVSNAVFSPPAFTEYTCMFVFTTSRGHVMAAAKAPAKKAPAAIKCVSCSLKPIATGD